MEDKKMKMTFKNAVEEISDIKDGFCKGLQALGEKSKYVFAADNRKIDGSVDIDACTKSLYPDQSRWDYAIGYDEIVYFLEIHPANTSSVKEVIKKAEWLSSWLSHKAKALQSLSAKKYYWMASGKYDILPTSRQFRQLSQSKIQLISDCRLPLT